MTALILPSRFRQQPATAQLDYGNAITRGLVDVFNPAASPYFGALTSSVTIPIAYRSATAGYGITYDGSSSYHGKTSAPIADIGECTLLVVAAPLSSSSTTRSIFGYGTNASGTPLLFIGQGASSGQITFWARDGASTSSQSQVSGGAQWANGVPATLIGTRSQSGNYQKLWINNTQLATASATSLAAVTFDRTAVGGLVRNSFALGWNGTVFLALAWNRGLSDAEALSLADNPWQVFKAPPRKLWVVSSSATNYTLTAAAGSFALTGTNTNIKPYGWTALERTLPSSLDWNVVAHNGTVFCALPYGSNTCATSTDGVSWTSRSLPATRNWTGIASNGSIFVAIAEGTDQAATSSDGITWTNRTLPSSASWGPIAWNGSVFCVLDQAGTTKAATSSDGITWDARTMPSAAGWSGIATKGSLFCAVASFAPGGTPGDSTHAATSTDGITWTARTLPSTADYREITCNGTTFVATVDFSNFVATSTDGITWATPALAESLAWRSAGWNGTHFVVIARNDDAIATSPTGAVWKAEVMPNARLWQGFAANSSGLGVTLAGGTSTVSATVVTVSSGAALYSITAAPGSFSETGNAAGLYLNRKMAAVLGTYALTGVAVGDVVVPTGTVTSQPAPDGQTQQFVGTTTNAGSGEYTLTGSNGGVTVGPSAFTVTANAFDFTAIELEPGDYAPILRAVGTNYRAVMSGTSAFTINGVGGGGGFEASLTADTVSFALTGNNASFAVARPLAAAVGTYALTGNTATFTVSHTLAAAAATYALTGNDVLFSGEKLVVAEAGTFALAGSDATLFYSKHLAAETASYFAPTRSAGLYIGYRMAAAAGSFALSGVDAVLRKGSILTAASQTYNITGNAVTFHSGYTLPCVTATFALAGSAAAPMKTKYLGAAAGSFALTGNDILLPRNSAPYTPAGLEATGQLGTVGFRAWGIISTRQFIESWTEIDPD